MKVPTKQPNRTEGELTPLDSTHLATARVPVRVRIAPWGQVESTSGRFVVDDESAQLVVEAFTQHETDLPIDYEHQTLGGAYASPSGQAPAAGWIKKIDVVPNDGIYAYVEWTAPALEQLAAKQYRYLSPVALVRKSDRKLIGLHSVALTNKPAIAGMDPLVNRAEVQSDARTAMQSLREHLELEADSDVDTILVAADRRLDALHRDRELREAEDLVRVAVRSGKVTPAQREFAVRLALRDPNLFDEWVRTTPVVIPLGRTSPPDTGVAVASQHGLAAKARLEFRAHPALADLTSEDAFVADTLRQQDARTIR